VDKKHLLAGLVALVALLMVFVVGCKIVSVPDAQQTPIVVTVLGFAVQIGMSLWGKADTAEKLKEIGTKADQAASAAAEAVVAAKSESVP
jgi:hypothetical protein